MTFFCPMFTISKLICNFFAVRLVGMESGIGKTALNIVKMGLLFFAVGAILSYAVPYIGVAAGIGAANVTATITPLMAAAQALDAAANPIYLGLLFGGFGALDAAMRPVFDWVFGGGQSEVQEVSVSRTVQKEIVSPHEARVSVQPEVARGVENDKGHETSKFQEKLANQRAQQQAEILTFPNR